MRGLHSITVRALRVVAAVPLLVAVSIASGAAASPPPDLVRVTGGHLPTMGPRVKAPVAIVIDAGSGEVLYAKRPYMRRPIASTTKIMTAVVALSRLRLGEVVRVPREATRVEEYREGLKKGERVPVWKLLYGLLLVSGNDTAVTLAVAAGGTREHFIALMNEKARELGLRHTHFRSASGLIDEGNFSTVWDLAALARYALANPHFRSIVATKHKRVWWRPPTHAKLYENHNKLLWRYPGADGVKTGWTTRAGPCLVASAHRHGVGLISVVLDSPDHYGDTIKLLNFGFAQRG
jgi:D-alanyl-D-alanine carboxypeptidase (penicillin-binding protein 5/6)